MKNDTEKLHYIKLPEELFKVKQPTYFHIMRESKDKKENIKKVDEAVFIKSRKKVFKTL